MLALVLPYICFGLYNNPSLQNVSILASLYILLTVFFRLPFSSGGGVLPPGVNELQLFPCFCFCCMLPGIQDKAEGCPAEENLNIFYMMMLLV